MTIKEFMQSRDLKQSWLMKVLSCRQGTASLLYRRKMKVVPAVYYEKIREATGGLCPLEDVLPLNQ